MKLVAPRPTPLPLAAWLAVPVLFATAVLGVTAILGLLLSATWQPTLSPALFGGAAAVTGLIGVGAEWSRYRKVCARQLPGHLVRDRVGRRWLPVPTVIAIPVGLPALAVLGYLCRQERSNGSVVVD